MALSYKSYYSVTSGNEGTIDVVLIRSLCASRLRKVVCRSGLLDSCRHYMCIGRTTGAEWKSCEKIWLQKTMLGGLDVIQGDF
jgi:hypothetical protein